MRVAFITWCAALANNTHCHAEALRAGRGGGEGGGRLSAQEEKEEDKGDEKEAEEDKEDMMSQVRTLMLAGLELFDHLLGTCVLMSSSPGILSLSLSL